MIRLTHLYVNFLSKLTRPGDPSAAANVGQNFCHKNAVKCGLVCTFFGSAVVNVRTHSVKYNEPHESLFFGVPTLEFVFFFVWARENKRDMKLKKKFFE